jgi:hypothetical protein
MPEAYIIVAYGGEYEDYWEENVSVFTDLTAAELEVIRLNDLDSKLHPIHKELIDEYWIKIGKSHVDLDPVPDVPCLKNDKEQATAMKNWMKETASINERNTRHLQVVTDRINQEIKDLAIEKGCDEEMLAMFGLTEGRFATLYRDRNYRINTVPLNPNVRCKL